MPFDVACSDDYFDDDDALVACRQLGFSGGSAIYQGNATYRILGGNGTIWLDNLVCNSSVHTRIEQCWSHGWGVHNCAHFEDVGVYCTASSQTGQARPPPSPPPPPPGTQLER